MEEKIRISRQTAAGYQMQLKYLSPFSKINDYRQQLMHMEDDMQGILKNKLTESRHRLALYSERLSGISPLKQLERGYAIVSKEDGKSVHSSGDVETGDKIHVRFLDGYVDAVISETHREGSVRNGKK